MNILCTICSDLLNQAESIYVTKCGHMFHHHCLAQWIERSRTCPQCRNKVTDKCMFRLYPNISNEISGDDVATLQSRLDNAQLQLRQQNVACKEKEDKLTVLQLDLKKNEELLKSFEKKLVSRDSAVNALKEQLEYVKLQNKETQKLKDENESLKKNLQLLNGLNGILNAASEEAERMLHDYTDVRTVATFATALKRGLCDSESKKKELRDRLHATKQQLGIERNNIADLKTKLVQLEIKLANKDRKYKALKKRKADMTDYDIDHSDDGESANKHMRTSDAYELSDAAVAVNNDSFGTLVNRIESSDSPYLSLKQSSLVLSTLQRAPKHAIALDKIKPTELALINCAKNAITRKQDTENLPSNSQKLSIFNKKEPAVFSPKMHTQHQSNTDYDGLGGHSKLDVFPVPNRQRLKPKITSRHKLKRPNPTGSLDISKMFEKH